MYTQSYALLRLWARQLGKYDGKNDLERYYVDAITDIASDWRSKCMLFFLVLCFQLNSGVFFSC
jgi:glutathione S-transferase